MASGQGAEQQWSVWPIKGNWNGWPPFMTLKLSRQRWQTWYPKPSCNTATFLISKAIDTKVNLWDQSSITRRFNSRCQEWKCSTCKTEGKINNVDIYGAYQSIASCSWINDNDILFVIDNWSIKDKKPVLDRLVLIYWIRIIGMNQWSYHIIISDAMSYFSSSFCYLSPLMRCFIRYSDLNILHF